MEILYKRAKLRQKCHWLERWRRSVLANEKREEKLKNDIR